MFVASELVSESHLTRPFDVGDAGFEAVLFDPVRDVLRQKVLLLLDITGGSLRYTGVPLDEIYVVGTQHP